MRARRLFVYCSLAALSLSILDNASAQVSSRPMLTGTAAMEMVQGCIAKADAEGWRMHIAILDNHGNLKAYHRMDDAQLLSHDVALAKARTSASSPRSTQQWGDMPFGNGLSAAAFA